MFYGITLHRRGQCPQILCRTNSATSPRPRKGTNRGPDNLPETSRRSCRHHNSGTRIGTRPTRSDTNSKTGGPSDPKSQQVMQFQARPPTKEQAAPPLSKSTEGAARPQRPPTKMGPAAAHKKETGTHSEDHKPLNSENTCPRWDSNCIPSPANTGLPPETCGIRPDPAPVRTESESPKWALLYTPQIGQFRALRTHSPMRRLGITPTPAQRWGHRRLVSKNCCLPRQQRMRSLSRFSLEIVYESPAPAWS